MNRLSGLRRAKGATLIDHPFHIRWRLRTFFSSLFFLRYFFFAIKPSVLLIERLNLGVLGVSWSGYGEGMTCLSAQLESL
jgi:hypothetical protein